MDSMFFSIARKRRLKAFFKRESCACQGADEHQMTPRSAGRSYGAHCCLMMRLLIAKACRYRIWKVQVVETRVLHATNILMTFDTFHRYVDIG